MRGPAEPGSWNRYAYVQGDPVNKNDPEGPQESCVDAPFDVSTYIVSGDIFCRPKVRTPLNAPYTVEHLQAIEEGFNQAVDRALVKWDCLDFYGSRAAESAPMRPRRGGWGE